jgi:membrane protease YdiL (CAAX protease family)
MVPMATIDTGQPQLSLTRRHPLSVFFAAAYTSWVAAVILWLYLRANGAPKTMTKAGPVALLLLMVFDVFPSVAGILMTRLYEGKGSIKELFARLNRGRASRKWYSVAVLTNPIVVIVVLLVLANSTSSHFLPEMFSDPAHAVILPFALFIGFSAGFMEEFGWTGFALPRLLQRYRPFTAGLLLGIIWAVWHVPIVLWAWPAARSSNVALQIGGGLIWCAALVPYRLLMSWAYANTDSSLLIGVVMHAFYDGTLAALLATDLTATETTQFSAALTVALSIVAAAVFVLFRTRTATAVTHFTNEEPRTTLRAA